ncbi:alpha/beta fold hydrolase [Rickettsiales endosymbiont of Peranema trichophorum]|uniref:alpha/beta fold hydrolase n=1 Tax=Rickettsiales endosymbiont of Peranema trichophorum TaxID=2486577 RepID=UPI0013EE4FE0|nr:alpha/beta fold hydrolase [Rickettsiales endosymbiont of Peranema trichophorum]
MRELSRHGALELNRLLQGLNRYNSLKITTPKLSGVNVWSNSVADLYCYRGESTSLLRIPLLLVPSHINRSYILDLPEQLSFVDKLSSLGITTYVIDWKQHGVVQNFNYSKYMQEGIGPILTYIEDREQEKPIIGGYCMGGLFATAASVIFPALIRGLVTIATPWNFHGSGFLLPVFRPDLLKYTLDALKHFANIPGNLLKLIFYAAHFDDINRKYIEFSTNTNNGKFGIIEHWVHDNVDLSAALFLESIDQLFVQNQTANKTWSMCDRIIDPSQITQPSLCAIARNDKIVPVSVSLLLPTLLKRSTIIEKQSGHLGMITSQRHCIAQNIAEWIRATFR